jgi:hypothetical protein
MEVGMNEKYISNSTGMLGREAKRLYLSEGGVPFDIWTEICSVGTDINIVVGGGERPHIGGVALAEPAVTVHPVSGDVIRANEDSKASRRKARQGAASTDDGATRNDGDERVGGFCRISVLSAASHKDVAIAEIFASAFCDAFGVNVCACAGVHVEHASDEMIEALMENASKLLERTIATWRFF